MIDERPATRTLPAPVRRVGILLARSLGPVDVVGYAPTYSARTFTAEDFGSTAHGSRKPLARPAGYPPVPGLSRADTV